MDNQQCKTNKDIAWLGGFIDGEGSFMIIATHGQTRVDGSSRQRFEPAIKISGTEVSGLNHTDKILDDLGLPHHISWRTPQNALHKKSWMVEVKGVKRCFRWCDTLMNYLVVKKHEASLLKEYCDSRLSRVQHGCQTSRYALHTERETEIINSLRGRRKGSRLC